MLKVSVKELEDHIPDLQAGQSLTLLHGGKALADVVPISASDVPISPSLGKWKSEEERLAAVAELMQILRTGFDLGGFKITDRDALYDRDE